MVYLPHGILVDVVRRIGSSGFRELGPFITSGPKGRNAAFDAEVLAEADLDEFVFVSSLANKGSTYRHFFMRCFEAGNITAKYVEGLRRAVKYGPSTESLELIHSAESHIVYAAFANAIFEVAGGNYEQGMQCMATLAAKVSWLEEMVEIGDDVMAQVADLGPPMCGNYNETFRYPAGDVPNCIHFACSMYDVCFECIAYWYARRVALVC